jgi:hypothetical protein
LGHIQAPVTAATVGVAHEPKQSLEANIVKLRLLCSSA